jgi:hypothetical protein
VQFTVGPISNVGLAEEAADLVERFSVLAGKPLTERNPYLEASALLENWDEFTQVVLPIYRSALLRTEQLKAARSEASG